MIKPMPIGIDDFKEVREGYYFVDKSFFLKKLIDGHSKVTLCTRPRRFGKTLIMSMVKYFFDQENGESNRHLFEGLMIEKAGEKYLREQGKYPVIFLTLKGVKKQSWEDEIYLLGEILKDFYQKFIYLEKSQALNEQERNYVKKLLRGECNQSELELSLARLTNYLYKHHGKKPILLLDEYDVPIQHGFEQGYYEEIINFMKVWLDGGLKGNTSLEFAVLTGVLRVAKESIFSDLNNLEVNSIVRGDYENVFGFTEEEVRKIAGEYGAAEKTEELKKWYDGYNFGGTEIYNPWSVINYFRYRCEAGPYWLNTSGNMIIRNLLDLSDLEMREEITELFRGKPLETTINEGLVYEEIYKRKNALYTMLLTTGYLTIEGKNKVGNRMIYSLRIPNLEIETVYESKIMEYLAEEMEIEDSIFLMRDLLRGEAESFARWLNKMLLKMMSYYDSKKQDKEGFYHGLMLGLTALLSSSYQVKSNRESGCGRFNLAIIPKDRSRSGVIMEFKTAEKEEKLEEAAREALAQIRSKEYMAEFTEQGIRLMQIYGIAFWRKKVKLLGEEG